MKTKTTVNSFKEAKKSGRKISMLTAYDYQTAKFVNDCKIDAILVGDSLGMVVLGYEDTTKVTMDDMIHHTKAVVRGAENGFIVTDMPFLSYHTGVYDSVRNAGRLVNEGGCKAVKLEGGEAIINDVRAIINAGIPVMGHLGFTPQSVNVFGGHKTQGKTIDSAVKMLKDALLLEKAGVFSIVLECVPYKIAEYITKRLDTPTIGIGAGSMCDGQVLVSNDMLGLFDEFLPKHAKRYAQLAEIMKKSFSDYKFEVENDIFPSVENSFSVDDEILKELENLNITID